MWNHKLTIEICYEGTEIKVPHIESLLDEVETSFEDTVVNATIGGYCNVDSCVAVIDPVIVNR